MSMHIDARPGDFAERVILPGDPLRAKYIAENYLEKAVLVNDVRNMLAYTGYYKDQKISVFPTGMGAPTAFLYVTELCRDYGCKVFVRPGTCGAYREDIQLGDLIFAQAVSPTGNLLEHVVPGHFSPTADYELLSKAVTMARERGQVAHVGNVVCNDVLHFDSLCSSRMDYCKKWLPYGLLGQEMEGAGLYTAAARYGARAMAFFTVVVNYWRENEQLSHEKKETGLDAMLRLALDTAIEG